MPETPNQPPRQASRRHFLAASALPLAAAGRDPLRPDRDAAQEPLLAAARAYGRLVPAWTKAAEARAATPRDRQAEARFDAIDRAYDHAKRHLLRLMRDGRRPLVVDREAGTIYVDCSPAGSHEDVDLAMPSTAVVRLVPLSQHALAG